MFSVFQTSVTIIRLPTTSKNYVSRQDSTNHVASYFITQIDILKKKSFIRRHNPRCIDVFLMEGKNAFFVLLLQGMICSATFAAAEESRSANFITREDKRLKGYVVKTFESPSILSCSQLCLRNAWCTSTNFKVSSKKSGKGTCELNKHEISVINENTKFHEQQGVIFAMLLKVI